MKKNLVLLTLCCGVLLFAASAFAAPKQGNGQASITLLSCNVGACYSDNTTWALGKCEGAGCPAYGLDKDPNSPTFGQPITNPAAGSYAGQQGENITLDQYGNSGPINWSVAVQNVETSGHVLKVFGFMYIKNTGTATAYLGNFVANLQKKSGNNWPSAAADVADSTNGNSALQVNICSPATTNGVSSFSPSAGSGPLKLNVDGNDVLAFPASLAQGATMVLKYEADYNIDAIGLGAGSQVRMEAIVTFSNSGSRGGSGSSCTNASQTLIGSNNPALFTDINGDGTYTADEYYYRSVPCRTTFTIPVLSHDNQTVNLSDPMPGPSLDGSSNPITDPNGDAVLGANAWGIDPNTNALGLWVPWNASGLPNAVDGPTEPAPGLTALPAGITGVNLGGIISGGAVAPNGVLITGAAITPPSSTFTGNATLTSPASLSFGVQATAYASGIGGVDNCSTLTSANDIVHVNDLQGYFPNGFDFTCNAGVKLEACAWPIVVPPGTQPPTPVTSCSYTQGGWGQLPAGNNAGSFLTNNFNTVYPNTPHSVSVGSTYTMTFKDGTQVLIFCTTGKNKTCTPTTVPVTAPQAIENFLPQGTTEGALTVSLTNPTSSSAGVFGGQVLTLQLNVDFSHAGNIGWNAPAGAVDLGTVYYIGNKNSCAYNHTVTEILGYANALLGGGTAGSCTIDDLNTVATAINEGFDGCKQGNIAAFSATPVTN